MKKVTKIQPSGVAKETEKLRVAAYARVSTNNDDQLVSLEAQKTYYERFIRANPQWDYAGLYFDEGITGTKTDKRDGLHKMLADCRSGKIDFIIVKSISRLARNTVDTLQIVRELTERGIYLFFEKENINTGSMNTELLLTILSSLAQSESTSISANEKWSIQKRFEQGTYVIGCPPYGYKNEGGQMVINPEEADVVKFIFAQYLSGNGARRIAKLLSEKNIPTRRGSKWDYSVIISMLRNEKYTGDALFQKSYTDEQFNRHINHGDAIQYFVKNHHEAIISHEEFDKVQAVIENNAKSCGNTKGNKKSQNRYPFSGKIICGECGAKLKRRTHTVKDGKYAAYTCTTHIFEKDSCSMRYICEDAIHSAFTNMMNKLILYRNQILKPLLDSLRKANCKANKNRVAEINQLLENSMEERRKLMDLFTKGYLDTSIYQSKSSKLEHAVKKLTTERDALLRSANIDANTKTELEKLYRFCDGKPAYTEFPAELVEQFLIKATINTREEITFELKCGLHLRERMSNAK